MNDNKITEAEEIRRGEEIISVLLLKKKHSSGRYATDWGDKTALGLYRTIAGIVNNEKEG